MGGGGSKPKEIAQENQTVNAVSLDTQGLIKKPPEKFTNRENNNNYIYIISFIIIFFLTIVWFY